MILEITGVEKPIGFCSLRSITLLKIKRIFLNWSTGRVEQDIEESTNHNFRVLLDLENLYWNIECVIYKRKLIYYVHSKYPPSVIRNKLNISQNKAVCFTRRMDRIIEEI